VKYGTNQDHRGGGHFSGRLTAPIVAAGAIISHALHNKGIKIGTHIKSLHGATDRDFLNYDEDIKTLHEKLFPVLDSESENNMTAEILEAAKSGDSVGGVVGCFVENLPAGLGEPVFDKLDALIAQAMLSLGAVKGIEFGNGFRCADLSGSENNDAFVSGGKLATNRCGGVLGGISTGSTLEFRIAVKPTPSVSLEQKTVNRALEETVLQVKGRHDPCIVPRIVPVVEAMAAIVLCDLLLRNRSSRI
jgi:chorismate synthase